MNNIEIYQNKCLKNFCTFKIGGKAKFLFVVYSVKRLKQAVVWCIDNQIKFKVIGCGANLLFDDAGFNGAIIVNKANKISIRNNIIKAESGLTIAELISASKQKSLTGVEHFVGIPSTLGGAVTNNLGAWNFEIANFVIYVKGFYVNQISSNLSTPTKRLNSKLTNLKNIKYNIKNVKLKVNQCKFAYRDSYFKHINFVITHVKLRFSKAPKEIIETNLKNALNKKISTQPINLPSAGSVFKRTNVIPAKLIDECGLKGKKIGDAQVSTKHAGFIVNLKNATSRDVKQLINEIENKVFFNYSATLEREIEYVDF